MRPDVKRHPLQAHPERGAVLVLVAISMAVLLGFVALAVDLGYLMVTRNEVQNIADGSSLAGARALGGIYQGLSYSAQENYYCDEACRTLVRNVAQDVASKNRAGGDDMTVRVEDVLIGQWKDDVFTETYSRPDAVYVVARRDEVANGPISTFFARVLGIDERSVNALAIAAMTGQGSAGEGGLTLPLALSSWFFEDGNYCNDYIRFNPTNDPSSCGGWTTWDQKIGTNIQKDILDGKIESPELFANESLLNMKGGNVAAAFPNLLSLFQREGFATDDSPERNYLLDGAGNRVNWEGALAHPDAVPWLEEKTPNSGVFVQSEYPDGTPRFYHKWETGVPVYNRDNCENPNNSNNSDPMMVVGFARVIITDVRGSPDQQIDGVVLCNLVSPEENRGGGGEYGVKGPIPGLVR